MNENRFLFKFYYVGVKKFHGSQRQSQRQGQGYLTIEDCIIHALKKRNYMNDSKLSGFEVASRTDRFVSARCNVFSFISKREPFLMEINSALPKEIGIWAHAKVPIDFLARSNAIYRHYKYIVPNKFECSNNSCSIDFNLMHDASKSLEGRHDFLNFSKKSEKEVKTVRDMDSVKISIDNGFIIFDFKSRAFLRQQVRRMVKKILELGTGDFEYQNFLKLFDTTKYVSYEPANPTGLILWDIKYSNAIKFKVDVKSKERMENYCELQEMRYNLKAKLFKLLNQEV